MSSTTTEVAQPTTNVTPYRAAQIMTVQYRKLGLIAPDEEIAPQTMYSNKTIARTGDLKKAQGGAGQKFVAASFFEWMKNDAAARAAGGRTRAKVNVALLAEEFDLEGVEAHAATAAVPQTATSGEDVIAGLQSMASTTDEDAELAALEAEQDKNDESASGDGPLDETDVE